MAFKIVHSSTILLPAWKVCLEELKLPLRLISRDVTTRWNSTYDMLCFIVKYRTAVEHITSDRKNDLRRFELTEDEWVIASELCDTLKVHGILHNTVSYQTPLDRYSKMPQPTSLALRLT